MLKPLALTFSSVALSLTLLGCSVNVSEKPGVAHSVSHDDKVYSAVIKSAKTGEVLFSLQAEVSSKTATPSLATTVSRTTHRYPSDLLDNEVRYSFMDTGSVFEIKLDEQNQLQYRVAVEFLDSMQSIDSESSSVRLLSPAVVSFESIGKLPARDQVISAHFMGVADNYIFSLSQIGSKFMGVEDNYTFPLSQSEAKE